MRPRMLAELLLARGEWIGVKRRRAAVLVTLVLALLFGVVGLGSADWAAFQFQPGQWMAYSIWIEYPDRFEEGTIEFFAQETTGGEILLMVEMEFNGEFFDAAAAAEPRDAEGIYETIVMDLMMQLPHELAHGLFTTLLVPWFDSILAGETFFEGLHIPYDDQWGFGGDVVGRVDRAGREGWLLETYFADEEFLSYIQLGIDPELPLPILAAAYGFGEGPLLGASMIVGLEFFDPDAESRGDFDAADFEMNLDFSALFGEVEPTGVLADLLVHFESAGLEIGELSPKAYSMLGAAAGFGVEVDEEFFEVYWFDPVTTTPEIQQHLEQAKETGMMYFPALQWEIPGMVRGDILLTALEYGTFWVHPRKDDIEAAFAVFEP